MFEPMKIKIPIFLAASVLAVAGLTGCGSGGEGDNVNNKPETPEKPEAPKTPPVEEVANKTADALAGKLEILDGEGVKDYAPNREAEVYYVYHSASW